MGFRMQGGRPAPAGEVVGWDWAAPAAPPRHLVPSTPVSTARWALRGTLVGAAATLVAAAIGFAAFVARVERQERALDAPVDGIVALTGGSQRIGDAIDLLALGYGRRLLISGVHERTTREEIARLNPGQQHLIACCVDLDYRARNTIGNAIETRRWMREHRFRSVAVVTSNYHMPRTLVELAHALVPGERVLPHPVVTEAVDPGRWWRPAAARVLASEYVKFVVAWLRTRIERDPEHSHAATLIGRGKPVKPPVKMVAEPLMH